MITHGEEFRTEKGIGTYLGDINDYAVVLHFAPASREIGSDFRGKIDIMISTRYQPFEFYGYLSLDEIVKCAMGEGVLTELVNLSKEDCWLIDKIARSTLVRKYRIFPQEMLFPDPV